MGKSVVLHAAVAPWKPELGAICNYARKDGSRHAIKAEDVTCKTCLSWPSRIREAYEAPVYEASSAKPEAPWTR